MERAQNRFLPPVLRGGLVAVLAVAVLALALPSRAESPALDSPEERAGSSLCGGPTTPQQALPLVTTRLGTARLAPSGGGTPVLIPQVPALRPVDGPVVTVVAPPLSSRPPLRILFCTWLN